MITTGYIVMSVLFLKSIPPDPPQICEKPTLLWSMNVHPLNVIRGWSLQQHTTGYHRKKVLIQSWQQVNLLKQVFWHWMSQLSESMAMTPWSAMSFTILSVFELVNQVDRGLKWLTIQEDIQSYKSFQPCHSLVCEIHKAHPSQFLPAGDAKGHGQHILTLSRM